MSYSGILLSLCVTYSNSAFYFLAKKISIYHQILLLLPNWLAFIPLGMLCLRKHERVNNSNLVLARLLGFGDSVMHKVFFRVYLTVRTFFKAHVPVLENDLHMILASLCFLPRGLPMPQT